MAKLSRQEKDQVFSMSLRGYTLKEIASYYELDPSTVGAVLRDYKDAIQEHLEQLDQRDYTGVVMARFDEIRAKIWDGLLAATLPIDAARYLRLLIDVETKSLAALQSLGALDKTAEVHEHQVSGEVKGVMGHVAMGQLTTANLESLSALLIAGTMGTTPESVLSMGGRLGSIPERNIRGELRHKEIEIPTSVVLPSTAPPPLSGPDASLETQDVAVHEEPVAKEPVTKEFDFNFDL